MGYINIGYIAIGYIGYTSNYAQASLTLDKSRSATCM